MKQLLAIMMAAPIFFGSAHATVLYGVDNDKNLISFDSADPATTLSVVPISGLTGGLEAIDVRPLTNQLYGLTDDLQLVQIDHLTGVATTISPGPLALSGNSFGFDFNPTIDRIRVVTDTGHNYVLNPHTGQIQLAATDLSYAVVDPNFGAIPGVTGSAYTPSSLGEPGTTTQLYGIDTLNDLLVKQANNSGILTTVGSIGVDLAESSFEISFDGEAFALEDESLYKVDLATGALTLLGLTDRTLSSLTAFAVPEPTGWAMMLVGFAVVGFSIRRRDNRSRQMV
ncbi:hypothetical protein ACFB49_08510 [Sphingomonas sp. DBB INV C78]|uniref:DUF4394 domain-containing protein n=1 Tax=Sphingomonas sp. DBB INV C78 TaxID=3349434 RepID=UPI0036D4067E